MPQSFIFPSARGVPFDNSTNGFVSDNTQDAIEEAKTSSVAKSRFVIVTTFNGTIGNNQWLGFSELIPGNQVPIRIAIACKLTEIAFSYSQNNILGIPLSSEQVDGTFKLYKNGLTDPTNVVHTETFTNQAGGKIVVGLNVSLVSGDFIVGRWTDTGDNPSDMTICYYLQPV